MSHRLAHATTDGKEALRAKPLPVAAPVVPEDPQDGQRDIEVLAEQRVLPLRAFLHHYFLPLSFKQQLEGE
jgi:hypothetical protein